MHYEDFQSFDKNFARHIKHVLQPLHIHTYQDPLLCQKGELKIVLPPVIVNNSQNSTKIKTNAKKQSLAKHYYLENKPLQDTEDTTHNNVSLHIPT